jgi:hypothetical protein
VGLHQPTPARTAVYRYVGQDVTPDGALFTLPPTRPSDADRFACALLADPGAEWRADFGTSPAVATLLPANGGC